MNNFVNVCKSFNINKYINAYIYNSFIKYGYPY